MDKNKTIAIIGGTIWGNRGAESMLVTTIGKIRERLADAKFVMFSYYPDKDRELITDKSIQILGCQPFSLVTSHFLGALCAAFLKMIGLKIPDWRFFRVAKALDDSDMLLDIGGITFSDGREKYLPFNILTILPGMLLGTPVYKLAQAMGPFDHRLNHFVSKRILKKCAYIFARGEKTAEFLQDLGLGEEKVTTVTDIAFLYKPLYSLSVENEPEAFGILQSIAAHKKDGKKIVVCSPSVLVDKQSAKYGKDYSGMFLDLYKSLDADKYTLVFIPNASRQGSQGLHNNDLVVIEKIRERIKESDSSYEEEHPIFYVDFDINTEWVRNIIQVGDVLITSRFHAMISGLALKVPTIVVGWGHKYREIMDYFDMGDFSVSFQEFEDELISLIKSTNRKRKSISEKFDRYLPEVVQMAEKQFTYLLEDLN